MQKSLVAVILLVASSGGLSSARATPEEGTRELRIGNGISILPSYGAGFVQLAPDKGDNETTVSFRAGLGYFLSPHVEVGGSLGLYYVDAGSTSYKGPGFDLFLRLYARNGNVGFFFEPTLEFQYLDATGGSIKTVGPGADLGAEFFLAESWALRFSPTFRYYKIWASADNGGSADTTAGKYGLPSAFRRTSD